MAASFTHLHLHTEFSMLDGAARVKDVVAAARADGQPAIGITDHGNMYGVLDFYKEARANGIKPIVGTEAYMAAGVAARAPRPAGADRRRRRRRGRRREALLPPHPAGRDDRGLPQPDEAVERRLPRGVLLQAPRGLGAARAPPRRRDRHDRLPRRRGPPGPAQRRCGSRHPPGRPAPGHLRARPALRRAAGPRAGRAGQDQPAAARHRPAHRRPPARHQRQPLHHPGGRRRPRRPAVRADRLGHGRPPEVQVRGQRALPQVRGRDAPPLRRGAGGVRQHAVDRRAGRCRDRVRPTRSSRRSPGRPASPTPTPTSATSPTRAPSSATATPSPTRSPTGWSSSSGSSPAWGSRTTSSWCGT